MVKLYTVQGEIGLCHVDFIEDSQRHLFIIDRDLHRIRNAKTVNLRYTGPSDTPLPTDCPSSSGIGRELILSVFAYRCLQDLLEPHGISVPAAITGLSGVFGQQYVLFTVVTQLCVMDEQRTIGERFAEGGFMSVWQYEFLDVEISSPIFTDRSRGSHIFITDAVANRIRDENLTGFDFVEIWSSGTGGVPLPHFGPDIASMLAHGRAVNERNVHLPRLRKQALATLQTRQDSVT